MRATGAHIAIIGHITKDELLRFISGTELANGFFNRFHGPRRPAQQRAAVRRPARRQGPRARPRRARSPPCTTLATATSVTFDPEARERWIDIYGPLSRGEQGLFGAATSRAEAHVVRLAAIYATLDRETKIRLAHLEAALALWRYSAESARWIFGDSLGDPTADEIWTAAKERPAGVTRTEVSDMF